MSDRIPKRSWLAHCWYRRSSLRCSSCATASTTYSIRLLLLHRLRALWRFFQTERRSGRGLRTVTSSSPGTEFGQALPPRRYSTCLTVALPPWRIRQSSPSSAWRPDETVSQRSSSSINGSEKLITELSRSWIRCLASRSRRLQLSLRCEVQSLRLTWRMMVPRRSECSKGS